MLALLVDAPASRLTLRPILVATALAALLALGGTGCGNPDGHVKAVTTKEVEVGVEGIFKTAPAETRQLAIEVADAIRKQDYPTAWEKLQTLGGHTGLTPDQREFVASSTAAVGAEVQKAEAAGNEAAKQALEFHRANK